MFKFEEICELIQLVGSSGVSSVEVEHAGSRVRIDGRAQAVAAPAASPAAAGSAPQPTAQPVPEAPPAPAAAAPDQEAAPAEEENLPFHRYI